MILTTTIEKNINSKNLNKNAGKTMRKMRERLEKSPESLSI